MTCHILQLWAKRFNRRYGMAGLPATIFLTDRQRIADTAQVIRTLPRHSLVIIRDYDVQDRADYVKEMVTLSRRYGHKVLVGGDIRLALCTRADGVHFPEREVNKALGCKRHRPYWMVSTSAHSAKTLRRIAKGGLDFAMLSPVFPTKSHPGAKTLGMARFRGIGKAAALPLYPLGGIDQCTITQLKTAVIPGVAAIGVFSASK